MSKEKGAGKQDQPIFNVFGYGSLLWKQGFKFSTKKIGYIQGFKRKFWQENCTHRGTEGKVHFSSIFKDICVIQNNYVFFWYNDIRYANIDMYIIFLFVAWSSSYHTRG